MSLRTPLSQALHSAWIAFFLTSTATAYAASFSISNAVSGADFSVNLKINDNDDGLAGEVYVAAEYGGKLYYLNNGAWGTNSAPYYRGALASQTIQLANLNLASLSGAKLYVGYGRDFADMTGSNKFGHVATVPATAASARTVSKVEFSATPAPQSDAERASTYSRSSMVITYSDGTSENRSLQFHTLYNNIDKFNGAAAGQTFDKNGVALKDSAGVSYVAETPDANSLLNPIAGATASPLGGNPLHLVTHFEYQSTDSMGTDLYGKLPMTMKLAKIDQNKATGELAAYDVGNISMASVDGLWIPCAGSLSPWNTHLGSEEYEPDARCVESPSAHSACANATNKLDAMSLYLGSSTTPKAYNYGLTPEVTVKADGTASVVKHRTLGRISREKVQVMADNKTVYQGDDGTYNVLTMFVADTAGDLSAGTLYAAKWVQTDSSNGGKAALQWVKLGKSSDSALATLANNTKFSDIFDAQNATETKDSSGAVTGYAAAPAGYTQVMAGHSSKLVENLKLKSGMETAAAFLETRRYASYKGATTEFEKFEGVAVNAADKKLYLAMTRMRDGMENKSADPINHIKVSKLTAGAVYEMKLAASQTDSEGNPIASDYVGNEMYGLVLGEDIAKDAAGNTCAVDKICNPDNLWYSEKLRTLFIGEDSSTAHINNFLWAYNVNTKTLSRILSLPAGAESTGLQVVDNNGGFGYIMANYQHAGEFSSNIDAGLKSRLTPMIDTKKAAVGYIGLGKSLP